MLVGIIPISIGFFLSAYDFKQLLNNPCLLSLVIGKEICIFQSDIKIKKYKKCKI
jgi:hypothetical protein